MISSITYDYGGLVVQFPLLNQPVKLNFLCSRRTMRKVRMSTRIAVKMHLAITTYKVIGLLRLLLLLLLVTGGNWFERTVIHAPNETELNHFTKFNSQR